MVKEEICLFPKQCINWNTNWSKTWLCNLDWPDWEYLHFCPSRMFVRHLEEYGSNMVMHLYPPPYIKAPRTAKSAIKTLYSLSPASLTIGSCLTGFHTKEAKPPTVLQHLAHCCAYKSLGHQVTVKSTVYSKSIAKPITHTREIQRRFTVVQSLSISKFLCW